ncbi:hypothetical protein [Gimesia aquarii]|uniref:Uncharacterized protein n=1 Tax=Gimesia aquarii TaxID=2527964 RepID=A0A517X061_9PLAN|nr:hypothetical protein [Gimesia aquarii]QDU10899.1 hypothetical protein V202x_43120 [Gimesia aquarii]
MSSLMELVEQGETLTLLFIIAVLYYVGQLAVAHNGQLKKWGLRISLLTLTAYVLFEASRNGIDDATALLAIVLRGLILAGLALGMSWILLSALDFLFAPLGRWNRSWQATVRQRQHNKAQKQRERTEKEHRQREQDEWNRMAPEREQQQRAQQQAEAQRQADQRQREEIRLSCQLLYDQHAPALQARFPRERLADYFAQYLTDAFPPNLVETRAALLKETLVASLEQTTGNKQKFSSLNEIAEYFQEQKQEIESLNYDAQTRQSFLSSLNVQEDRAIREFLST